MEEERRIRIKERIRREIRLKETGRIDIGIEEIGETRDKIIEEIKELSIEKIKIKEKLTELEDELKKQNKITITGIKEQLLAELNKAIDNGRTKNKLAIIHALDDIDTAEGAIIKASLLVMNLKRNLRAGFKTIKLLTIPKGHTGHHITNSLVIPIPTGVHRACLLPNREKHREKVMRWLRKNNRTLYGLSRFVIDEETKELCE